MEIFYFGTVRVAGVIFLICSLLLFIQRKKGERSRLIFSGILFLSILSYLMRYIGTYFDMAPLSITAPSVFLMGIFIITCYMIYPIEVISPGWITPRRLLYVYSPLILLCVIYLITLWSGVEYVQYKNLLEMLPHIGRFDVWFRVVLCLLIYLPAVFLFFVPCTRKYNNTNNLWTRKYVSVVMFNATAYLLLILFNNIYVHIFYYYCTVFAALYFTYEELYVRLIFKVSEISTESELEIVPAAAESPSGVHTQLRERLETLMDEQKPWKAPDLTVVSLALMLRTNRTTLYLLIKDMGYDSYPTYINYRRVAEFIKIIENGSVVNIEDAFFEVGFRSKVNALRYFRTVTGTTPSEYMRRINIGLQRDDIVNP